MKKLAISLLSILLAVSTSVRAEQDPSARQYYEPDTAKFTGETFFNRLDLPTMFGLGFIPGRASESLSMYSSLYIEYRQHKTYDWFALIGMDTHNHGYLNINTPGSNVTSGERYSLDLMLGAGYRLPLVKDLADFYSHPYFTPWNFNFSAELGFSATHYKDVIPSTMDPLKYELVPKWYYFPMMKFNVNVEYFVGPKFLVFLGASWNQQLMHEPWDVTTSGNPTGPTGVLSLNIGFASFFE